LRRHHHLFGSFSDTGKRRQGSNQDSLSARETSATSKQNGHQAARYQGHAYSNLLHRNSPSRKKFAAAAMGDVFPLR
jgi:hypothetical protein